ncbi:DNA polymerase III subunit gamma/tau, partial [Rhizobiales bacterium L72]|nr:DNA polymerase III subunit gamma/tau [Propylenella binzhouense]
LAQAAPRPTLARPSGGSGAAALSRVAEPDAVPSARLDPPPEDAAGTGFARFEDIVARAQAERDRLLVYALERHVRPVRLEPGRLEIALTADAERDLPQRLSSLLRDWTGTRWVVIVGQDPGVATIHEARMRRDTDLRAEVEQDPLVIAALRRFPGAEIVAVRERPSAAPDLPAPGPEPGEADDADED